MKISLSEIDSDDGVLLRLCGRRVFGCLRGVHGILGGTHPAVWDICGLLGLQQP